MYPSYPQYRSSVCGRNCVKLQYTNHKGTKTIPKWVSICKCC